MNISNARRKFHRKTLANFKVIKKVCVWPTKLREKQLDRVIETVGLFDSSDIIRVNLLTHHRLE